MAVRKSELVGTRRGLGRGGGVESSRTGGGVAAELQRLVRLGAWRGCGVVHAIGNSQMPEARRRRF